MNNNNKVMVNVASGVFVIEDYINLDNSIFLFLTLFYPMIKPFLRQIDNQRIEEFVVAKKRATLIRTDCRKKLPFNDVSVDHIYCSHFLEHLYKDEAINLLDEFNRVLKPDGTIYLVVPDLAEYVDRYIKRVDGDDSADKFIESTILTWSKRPKFLFRLFNFLEGFGLTHLWMYDKQSLTKLVINAKFKIISAENAPAPSISREGLHIVAKKN